MLWVRAFHLIALFIWVGGLLFLTMLLARAAASDGGDELKRRLFAFGRRMYFRVSLPGLAVAFTMGMILIVDSVSHPDPVKGSVFKQGWFHAKLGAVIALLAIDHMAMRAVKKGHEGARPGRLQALHCTAASLVIVIVILTKVVGGV